MMRRARALGWIVALVALVMIGTAFSVLPAEGQALFGVTATRPSSLYSINPTTGAATLIGPISGFSPISAVAFHPTTGVLYAVGFNEVFVSVLLTINPATGAATVVGPTAINGQFPDMSFRSDGVLYAFNSFNGVDGIGTLNTATGAFTKLNNNGIVHQPGNGIAFSPGGVLYHAGNNVGTFDQITGALTPGANLTFPQGCPGFSRVNALAFHPGTGILFAAINGCGINRRLGTLNIATGVITDIGASAFGLDAIAFQPIPAIEPPLTDFRDVRRPNDIAIGPDLGGTGQEALNFTGTTGAAGDTWITVYDPNPPSGPATFGSVSLSADVLIHALNNKKGAGLLALYNEATSKKGLALTLYDAGNTDTLVLATVDQAGKLIVLKTVSLGAGIAENVWYRVSMDVTVAGGGVSVIGTVFRHDTPTDPDSPLGTQVGVPLTFSGTLGASTLIGVDSTGEVGILAAAVNAANSSSVTNITIEP